MGKRLLVLGRPTVAGPDGLGLDLAVRAADLPSILVRQLV